MRTKLTTKLGITLLGLVLAAGSSNAALIAYDQFNGYTAGTLGGQNMGFGWAGAWSGSSALITVAGDGSGGSISDDGGTDGWAGTARDLATPITTTGTYYFGYLLQETGNANHGYLALQDTTGASWAAAGNWNNGAQWRGVRNDNNNFGQIDTGENVTVSLTHFVIKLDFNTAGNEKMSVYVNPADAAALSGAADAEYIFTGRQWGDIGRINAARNNLNTADGGINFDEIRVGTAAADMFSVIPEPSTTALLGLGGLALVLRRRVRA